ncbi:transcription factor Ouib [Drosophila grimshawi]|uniref:GH17845 n=1 Tax=Drosophila grimshawi TaxID=7222 RepID=B4JSM6_DROGR|nr:transcription factor Ouib [Drosophila grimshawi]EDV94766.1 GH17845 [Drosophila grimshawi]
MEKENGSLYEVCRVCANKIKDKIRQRQLFASKRSKLLENLKIITGVELSQYEGLPNFICHRCHSELDLAIKFRERCIFSQNYLENLLQKSNKEIVFNAAAQELYEDLIDEEQLEYVDEDVQVVERNDDVDDDVPDDVSEMLTIDELSQFEEFVDEGAAEKQSKSEKRHFVLLQDTRPAKRCRNFFICEECGEFFKCQPDYNEHLKCHVESKEAKQLFACGQCGTNFNSSSALRQHRQQEHNGRRLFKCATCGETFLEHSAKQRHEIAHRNERPYPCLECDMIFASVLDLRTHSTIHANPTLRCELCNQDFATLERLDAHSKTYKHKLRLQQMQDELNMLCGVELEEIEIS